MAQSIRRRFVRCTRVPKTQGQTRAGDGVDASLRFRFAVGTFTKTSRLFVVIGVVVVAGGIVVIVQIVVVVLGDGALLNKDVVVVGGEDGVVRIVNAQSGSEDLAVREGEALLVRPDLYFYRETVSAVAWRPGM